MKILESVHEHDREFFVKTVSPLPRAIVNGLLRQYKKFPDRFSANTFLRESVKEIERHLPNGFSGIELKCSEDNLRNKSGRHAESCLRLFHLSKSVTEINPEKPLMELTNLPEFPLRKIRSGNSDSIDTLKRRYETVSSFAKTIGVIPPKPKTSVKQNDESIRRRYLAAIKRMCDKYWWLKALRKALNQKLESATHAANMVNRRAGLYASDLSVNRRKAQRERNQKILESLQATNENGDSFSLAELSDRNVSNPKVRRAELMVRIRGMENYANKAGLKGVLLTFTCPSKYHRSHSATGEPNAKWGGYTPLHGQNYLNNNWECIRAAFQRSNIHPIGMRVAEPQHDGTPHWHMLLFIASDRVTDAVDICRRYAMEEDGNEAGADKYRFDVLKVDPKKGSATGYIAKYISKNIDGSNLDKGTYGEDPIIAAQRVDTWRSV